MTTIRLHNTATRKKEVFTPIDPLNVRMYVCGPTVYDRAHIGNARPVVVFDVLYRLLRHVYGADHVTYVRNFTDVDDKINAKAADMRSGGDLRPIEELIWMLTDETIGWYHDDMDALGAIRPDVEPRATEYIDEMKSMIAILIAKGFAYTVRDPSNNPPAEYVLMDREKAIGDYALFAVDKYDDYGKLSGRSVDDMIAGARVEVAPYKRNPADFVLWKPSDADLPGWSSDWGRGRPGWHIECSAMSLSVLGEQFDIHGGGIDLQFPHHENEIAQSCCALATPDDPFGRDKFARYWIHNEMLQVEGKKMSKSLGNFFTVRDLLDQGIPGEVIRMVYLGTHYSKPMDWTAEKAAGANSKLSDYIMLIDRYADMDVARSSEPAQQIVEALADDLNTHAAMMALEQFADHAQGTKLAVGLGFLGILTLDEIVLRIAARRQAVDGLSLFADRLQRLRTEAKSTKDYSSVDKLKQSLGNAGVIIQMRADGISLEPGPNFDPDAIGALA